MTPTDKKLIRYLTLRRPEDADKFLALLGSELIALRPSLIGYVRSFKSLRDVENFVDDVIEDAFTQFRSQFLGEEVKMPFGAMHAGKVNNLLKGWLLARIGKPYAGLNSGKITNAIRRERRSEEDDLISWDHSDLGDPQRQIELSDGSKLVDLVLSRLSPKKRFVVRVHTGLHGYDAATPETLFAIAEEAGLEKSACKYIKAIAKDAGIASTGQRGIDQKTTGRLAAIKERQVRKIISEFKEDLNVLSTAA